MRHLNQLGQWSHWSDPIEFRATADVSPYRDLVITELMYHPAELTEAEALLGYEESDFEYIELWNRGSTPIDLAPLRFTKGIEFDLKLLENTIIESGQRIVLARNAEALALRYPEITVSGSWGADQLSNWGGAAEAFVWWRRASH